MRPNIRSTQLGGIANLALLAPVKPGFVEGAEIVTYARRLDMLLETLNAIRLASRESALLRPPFPDAVGRHGFIHSFRYAVVPPAIGESPGAVNAAAGKGTPDPGEYRLALNVTFDGGWEPYMRVIHHDLGPLLDAIFCNCDGYPAADDSSFDDYTRWVRSRELPGGLFYIDSPMTVHDQRYLEAVERIGCESARPKRARQDSAGFALEQPRTVLDALAAFERLDAVARGETVKLNLKALKGLHDLRAVYPDNRDRDDACLLRFARSVMPEFIALLKVLDKSADPQWLRTSVAYASQIGWLTGAGKEEEASPSKDRLVHSDAGIQGGIVESYPGVTHGCLVLLKVTDATAARTWLATLPVTTEADATLARRAVERPRTMHCNVAFTRQGLQALGVPQRRVDRFPQEFADGMEARAGLLGDVRSNHPAHWRRPLLRNTDTEVDLGTVHVVLQWRLVDLDPDRADAVPHPEFVAAVEKLDGQTTGLRVLCVEPMRSFPEAKNLTREHFGFVDGLSQPVIRPDAGVPAHRHWRDDVARGEVFLGYPNDRGDTGKHVYPSEEDALLDDGCFLVIRKLRQRVDRLDRVLRDAARAADPYFDGKSAHDRQTRLKQLKAKMMGREPDGRPLATAGAAFVGGNDFDYRDDPAGAQCPFQAHARRANPRTGHPTPRILRRGMSYGRRSDADLSTERGLYFMAYCASLAEQFEIIQRWVAGGNSSGVPSTHSDPFLGVPQAGERRYFHCFDDAGKAVRVDLGDRPLTELQWGLYLFVPSVTALRRLDAIVKDGPAPQQAYEGQQVAPSPEQEAFSAWKRSIEDPAARDAAWQRVIDAKGGELETPYGRLVADPEKILAILRDDGTRYSVRGYGRRFGETVGLGYLGLDPAGGHTVQAETPPGEGVNDAIAGIREPQAFAAAVEATKKVLKLFEAAGQPTADGGLEVPVDVARLGEGVIGLLCNQWFGLPDLPDGKWMVLADQASGAPPGKAACPADFFPVARHVFWPHPSDAESDKAKARGGAILAAVQAFLDAAGQGAGGAKLGPLSQQIAERLAHVKVPGLVARTIAGVMLGFPPTVHLNFLRVMRAWIANRSANPGADADRGVSLWDLQADLLAKAGTSAGSDFEQSRDALRDELLRQMRKAPVPEAIWREEIAQPGADAKTRPPTNPVVLGLVAAMKHRDADPMLMFGGARKPRQTATACATQGPAAPVPAPVHACPGYEMAVGVLLGIVSTLLRAGTLRATPSPLVVNLVTRKPSGG